MGGTLANPTIAVNPGGTLLTIGKAIGGMALPGPFGLAVALASGKLGDKDPCDVAFEAAQNMMEKTQNGNGINNDTKRENIGIKP